MAGGAAGAPTSGATGQATAQGMPSQASQYSNYGAQPNGAFYAGPMSGAPASGGFPSQAYGQQMNQPQYQQPQYQPQYGGGYGQGYGSPFGGMGQGFGGMYDPQPQYGYGGMGNQFMGGGMYGPRGGFGGGFDPYGGRPARSFGGRDMYGPRGGFDPRMAMQQQQLNNQYLEQRARAEEAAARRAIAQQAPVAYDAQPTETAQPVPLATAAEQQPHTIYQAQPTATAVPGRTEADWNRYAASARFLPGTDMEQAKKDWMNQTPPTQSGLPGFGGLGSINMMTGRPWESRSQRAQMPIQSLYAQLSGNNFR